MHPRYNESIGFFFCFCFEEQLEGRMVVCLFLISFGKEENYFKVLFYPDLAFIKTAFTCSST